MFYLEEIVKIEKYIFQTKACDSFSLAPMERAPKNYPKKCVNSKSPKIELDGFTKPGPSVTFCPSRRGNKKQY